VDVQFIASFAVITPEPEASHGLYLEALGLPLEGEDDGYLHSEKIDGSRHFGVWPLAAAARACFGEDDWPQGRPVPQASESWRRPATSSCTRRARSRGGKRWRGCRRSRA
jgi:hypothetical protein